MDSKFKLKLSNRVVANIFTGVIIALAYVLFSNFSAVKSFVGRIFTILSPVTGGLIIAYLFNMIMAPLERKPLKGIKKHGLKRAVSLTLTILIALLIVVGLLFAIIPQTIKSIESLVVSAQEFITESREPIEEFASKFEFGGEVVNALYGSWADVFDFAKSWVVDALPTVLNATKKVSSGLINAIIAFIIAIYVLADKERLCRNARLVVRALASEKAYERTLVVTRRSHRIFSGFIGGKLLDSLLVGIICFIFMLIFKWPFAALISVIIGVTNIIPTFGPFIGAIPSVLIIAIESPIQALYFAIFILLLQQFDGNVLGALILGDSTGLSAFWVMVAITFFGALWGISGMVVGVPIVAVLYVSASEYVRAKLAEKQVDIDAISAPPPEVSSPNKAFERVKNSLARLFRVKSEDARAEAGVQPDTESVEQPDPEAAQNCGEQNPARDADASKTD